MIVSRFEKSYCLLNSSVPLSWQPNLIKRLPTGATSKLMIQTREPIPKYTLLNPVSLLWTWHFKHDICHKFSIPWLIVLQWCLQVVENGCVRILYKDLPGNSQMTENLFYIYIKVIVAFHVKMLQQLQLPVNSVNGKHEEYHREFFNIFNIANNITSTQLLY